MFSKIHIFYIILVFYTEATNLLQFESVWLKHIMKHKLDIPDEEIDHRKNIFFKNLKMIENFNKNSTDLKLGLTHLTHFTNEEYKVLMLTEINKEMSHYKLSDDSSFDSSDVPSEIDWRNKNAVTSVKNQGVCGSCWAFSTVEAVEGALAIKNGTLVSLSSQQLVDCSTENYGCEGGNPILAYKYMESNLVEKESDYSYKGIQLKCKHIESDGVTKISDFIVLKPFDENLIKLAVAHAGPVSAAVDASNFLFQHYKSGVHYDSKCHPDNINHAVLIVGYGTTNKKKDYFIIKNHWGINWGMKGFGLMARNKNNNCGIASLVSYPIL